jgi:hypothetical protein
MGLFAVGVNTDPGRYGPSRDHFLSQMQQDSTISDPKVPILAGAGLIE